MKLQFWTALSALGLSSVTALGPDDADTVFNDWTKAFIRHPDNGDVYYKIALNNGDMDKSWSGSLNILGAEDAFDRIGDETSKALVNDLLHTWLRQDKPPWKWNGWNDDLGWYTMALIRGYQITGTKEFLDTARYGFDYAWTRWNTEYNDGGFWEEEPSYFTDEDKKKGKQPVKEALSNDSLGKVACLIYQSTHDRWYLDRCRQIYDWVHGHLYNSDTGRLHTSINKNNTVNTDSPVYSQGTFLDFAHLLYKITLDSKVYDDTVKIMRYGRQNLTVNGIYSNSADHLHTWADEMARGAGNFVRDHNLWDEYYSWMVDNANAILKNRRSDWGITWNAWDTPTPHDDSLIVNTFVSAVAWLQYTPATKPSEVGGIHTIVNKKTGMAIDSAGTFGNGNNVIQWGPNADINQRWQLTQNKDKTWNIVALSTWQAIDNPNSNAEDGTTMIQWQPNRYGNQKWSIRKNDDGSYGIFNQDSGKALDGGSNSTNGAPLIQWGWNGQDQQRWHLK